MRLVILDGYTLNPGDLSWKEIESLAEVTYFDRTPSPQIAGRLRDAEQVQSFLELRIGFGIGSAKIAGHRDVVARGEVRQQIEFLEHEAYGAAAHARAFRWNMDRRQRACSFAL